MSLAGFLLWRYLTPSWDPGTRHPLFKPNLAGLKGKTECFSTEWLRKQRMLLCPKDRSPVFVDEPCVETGSPLTELSGERLWRSSVTLIVGTPF